MPHVTRATLNGPRDLTAAIPYLLGFTPEHSLVIVGLNGNGLQCTLRIDLPDTIEELNNLRILNHQLQRNGCTSAVLIAYGEATLATAVLNHASREYEYREFKLLDLARVTDGRYHCHTPGCNTCPAEGQPVLENTAVTTAMAVHGLQAHPNRAAITALLAPVEAATRATVATAIDDTINHQAELSWPEQRAADLHTIDHWTGTIELPGPDDIAALALAVGEVQIRDYAMHVIAGQTDHPNPVDLWIWVARHATDDLAAPPLTIAGWCAYRAGDGVLALECFSRALELSPGYRLALTTMALLQAGVPPQDMRIPEPYMTEPESSHVTN